MRMPGTLLVPLHLVCHMSFSAVDLSCSTQIQSGSGAIRLQVAEKAIIVDEDRIDEWASRTTPLRSRRVRSCWFPSTSASNLRSPKEPTYREDLLALVAMTIVEAR
jgi:hypothetical protein